VGFEWCFLVFCCCFDRVIGSVVLWVFFFLWSGLVEYFGWGGGWGILIGL